MEPRIYRSLKRFDWLLMAMMCSGCLSTTFSQSVSVDPLSNLRELTKGTKANRSISDAQSIADELVRLMPLVGDTRQWFSRQLANEQYDWHEGRRTGLDHQKLVVALNKHMALEGAPEYLKFRTEELIRV